MSPITVTLTFFVIAGTTSVISELDTTLIELAASQGTAFCPGLRTKSLEISRSITCGGTISFGPAVVFGANG